MKKLLAIILALILVFSMTGSAFALTAAELNNLERYFAASNTNVEYILASGETSLKAGTEDILIVLLYNRGGQALHDGKILVTMPAGVSIANGAETQVVGNVAANAVIYAQYPIAISQSISGESAKFTVAVTGKAWTETSLEDGGLGLIETEGKPISESFYIPVEGGSSAVVSDNPILLLTDYNCGGNVLAGATFGLSMTFLNTSKSDLHNIKFTVAGGSFVPVGSSNSFYMEEIKAGEKATKVMTLSCPKDTIQGQYALTVSSTYNEGSSSDTISIPVFQETRLVIDDILDPGWLTMSDMCFCNVNYRNMGNNQINNLTITVEGDFTVEGNSVYYVGNMASGRQDSYSFNFYPNQAGPCQGTVKFTYEDADGIEHYMTKDFLFNIGEGYDWNEPIIEDPPFEEPGFHMPIWGWIAVGVAGLIVLIIVIKLIKKRKAKKQEALELDEY